MSEEQILELKKFSLQLAASRLANSHGLDIVKEAKEIFQWLTNSDLGN